MFDLNPQRRLYLMEIVTNRRPKDRYQAVDGMIEVYVVAGRIIEIPKSWADEVRSNFRT